MWKEEKSLVFLEPRFSKSVFFGAPFLKGLVVLELRARRVSRKSRTLLLYATVQRNFSRILSQGSNHGNGIEVSKLSSAYAGEYGPNFEGQVGIKLKLFLKAHRSPPPMGSTPVPPQGV